VMDGDLPLPAPLQGAVTAHVPVVLGCSHACSFCVIPYRRGPEHSRPREEILAEVRSLARQGIREVMLLGQIVDRYGVDFDDGTDLSQLLRDVAAVEGLHRVRFLTSHPNYMTDALLETVAGNPILCPQLEVAVQAGNDEVLARMRRGYTAEHFRALVERIRQIIPDAAIHTDIIVGFPGETDAQFEDTRRLLADLRLDKVHISKYSERPKTLATRQLPDDILLEVKEARWQVLEDQQAAILEEKNRPLRGQILPVLVEAPFKGRWRGRTPHAKVVFFDAPGAQPGDILNVQIDWTGPFSLTAHPPVPQSCS